MKCAQSCEVLLHLLGRDPELLVSNHTGSKAQGLTGQSPGLDEPTLFPLQGFVPKGFPCKVFNEGILQGSKLDLGSTKVKLEGEC